MNCTNIQQSWQRWQLVKMWLLVSQTWCTVCVQLYNSTYFCGTIISATAAKYFTLSIAVNIVTFLVPGGSFKQSYFWIKIMPHKKIYGTLWNFWEWILGKAVRHSVSCLATICSSYWKQLLCDSMNFVKSFKKWSLIMASTKILWVDYEWNY